MSTTTMGYKLKAISKVLVTALGFAAVELVKYADLVPVEYRGYSTAIIGLATIVGAYHAPYAPLYGRPGA